MLRHHELSGDELHNAKINLEPPTRSPAYLGETVFDGVTLWIATGITADLWTPSHKDPVLQVPPFFSWSLDLRPITLGRDTVISLYFSEYSFEIRDWFPPERIAQYRFGANNFPQFGGIISLNSWIEQRGLGRYMPLISRYDRPVLTEIEIEAISPASAAAIVNIGRVIEPGTSLIHTSAKAIEISKCQAGFAGKLTTPFG